MRSFFFCSIVLILSLTACQSSQESTVQGEPISASFYVRYLRDVGQVLAQAEFFEEDSLQVQGGTPIELADKVYVENNPMRVVKVDNRLLRYRYQNQEGLRPGYTFRFLLPEGEEQQVTVELPVIQEFSVKAGIRKSTGMVLIIDTPLRENEEVQALFVDENRQITPINIQGPTTRNEIPLSAAAVRDLKLGDGFLYLLRRRRVPISMDKVDGVAVSEFYTPQIQITVEE